MTSSRKAHGDLTNIFKLFIFFSKTDASELFVTRKMPFVLLPEVHQLLCDRLRLAMQDGQPVVKLCRRRRKRPMIAGLILLRLGASLFGHTQLEIIVGTNPSPLPCGALLSCCHCSSTALFFWSRGWADSFLWRWSSLSPFRLAKGGGARFCWIRVYLRCHSHSQQRWKQCNYASTVAIQSAIAIPTPNNITNHKQSTTCNNLPPLTISTVLTTHANF